MPRYDYECPVCGQRKERWVRIEDLDDAEVFCDLCWGDLNGEQIEMKRLISGPSIKCDLVPYFDENIGYNGGEWVTSHQHRKELMKQNKLYERG